MCRWTSGEARGGRVIVGARAARRRRPHGAHARAHCAHPPIRYNAQRNNTFHY